MKLSSLTAIAVGTIVATATVNMPTDTGAFKQFQIKSRWDAISKERLNEIHRGIREGEIKNEDVVHAHLRELPGLLDDDGNPVPFESARDALVAIPAACNALANAFFQAMNGVRIKN